MWRVGRIDKNPAQYHVILRASTRFYIHNPSNDCGSKSVVSKESIAHHEYMNTTDGLVPEALRKDTYLSWYQTLLQTRALPLCVTMTL